MKRRNFIKNVSLSASAGIVVPTIISSSVLTGCGKTAPSDRIRLAMVGCAGRGAGNTLKLLKYEGTELVAICDVDKARMDKTKNGLIKGKKWDSQREFQDYRELIEFGEFDAAVIGVPDHWHAKLYTDFANAKFDVYGEKPLVRRVKEGRVVSDAVRNNNVVFQTGSWQRSTENFIKACELVNSGAIGEVKNVDVALLNMSRKVGMPPVQDLPQGLNYEIWQGPAPEKAYRGILHKHWRWQSEYAAGTLTDWIGHHYDIAAWAMDVENTGPVEIEGTATYLENELFDVPRNFDIRTKFRNGLNIRISEASNFDKGMGIYWHGEEDWIYVGRKGISASDPKILNSRIPSKLRKFRHDNKDHEENFLHCLRTRETPISDVESAHRAASAGLLGEIACLTGEKLKWNPDAEELIGASARANSLLSSNYRAPWVLEGL